VKESFDEPLREAITMLTDESGAKNLQDFEKKLKIYFKGRAKPSKSLTTHSYKHKLESVEKRADSGKLVVNQLLARQVEPMEVYLGPQVVNVENAAKNFGIYAAPRMDNAYAPYEHNGKLAKGKARTAYRTS